MGTAVLLPALWLGQAVWTYSWFGSQSHIASMDQCWLINKHVQGSQTHSVSVFLMLTGKEGRDWEGA
jgi:hypothetical protein